MTGYCAEFIGYGMLFRIGWRKGWPQACLWFGIAGCFWTVGDIMVHVEPLAIWTAVFTAYYLWVWWTKGGGGDRTKKRLKKWARKFQGVRRTAPQMG
jgi:hypothetical protein